MARTCSKCGVVLTTDAKVCWHCHRSQASISKFAYLAVILLLLCIVFAFISRDSGSARQAAQTASADQVLEAAQRSAVQTASAILPSIQRYVDYLEGRLRLSPSERKKEAADLKTKARLASEESARASGIQGSPLQSSVWQALSEMLLSDAQVMEAVSTKAQLKQFEWSADKHRQVAAALAELIDEDSERRARRALDEIYRNDPDRARELADQARREGFKTLRRYE